MKIILTAILILCNSFSFAQELHDIIKPLRLQSGYEKEVVISDLFFSEDYSLSFSKHPQIEINHISEKNIINITPDKSFEGLTLISFKHKNKLFDIPTYVEKKISYTFRYASKTSAEKVYLFGSFNQWNRESHIMIKKNNQFELDVPLEPGRYEYKFIVDGKELLDNNNPEQQPNGMGGFNSILTISDEKENKLFLHIIERKDEKGVITFSFELESKKNISLDKNNFFALLNNSSIPKEKIKIHQNKISVTLESSLLIGRSTLRVAYVDNGITSNMQTIQLFDGVPAGATKSSKTWNDAIMYSLMIDRFYDGDKANSIPVNHPEIMNPANYNGGDIQGLINKLDEGYFDSLGINLMWISPVNENTNEAFQEYPAPHRYYSGYHGYWPIHHERVEEKFGDMELLKEFINKAHKKGIKVLLDFVANHVHIEHPFWKKNRDWFGVLELPDGKKNLRLWDEQRLTTWFEPYLPSFDYVGSCKALEVMTDNAIWWLKQTNADGFRHDAVKHVPNEFWRLLTEKIKREIEIPENKIVYQIGETFGSYELVSSYVNNGQLSSQFNFNLYDVAVPAFSTKETSFKALDNQMQRTFNVYGENHLMGNVVDSHDKVRFMAYADSDIIGDPSELAWSNPPKVDNKSSYYKMKLHLAYILSIPGIPIVYYGDEIGMTGASDPDNRRMMRFGEDISDWERETLYDVRKMINARNEISSLRNGDFKTLQADDNFYIYLRSDLNDRVLVVLNKSEKEESFSVEIPVAYNKSLAEDVFTNKKIPIENGRLSSLVKPFGYYYFVLK